MPQQNKRIRDEFAAAYMTVLDETVHVCVCVCVVCLIFIHAEFALAHFVNKVMIFIDK